MKYFLLAMLALMGHQAHSQSKRDYFQQEVNTTINVRLDDRTHFLHGDITIEYINQSPDTLSEFFMHLWPNAYKNEKTALAQQMARDGNFFLYYSKNKDRGGIDSLAFTMNGQAVTYEFFKGFEDIAKINISKPILPGEKVVFKTPFRVKLPSGSISRLGHIEQSYQITQWYPKPSVYDRDGWHPIPYLTQGEFYSEFGKFDVSITLPANYTVGATGDLQTASEIERLNKLAEAALPEALNNQFPPSDAEMKTLRYIQSNVHDFGWFADKRWIVRKGSVVLPNTNHEVTTWAMFTPLNAKQWEKGVEYINDGLYHYSLWAGDYPYNQCTAVDGTISAGGGMEYPNVTVIGNSGNDFQLATVIIHEVGHNWFYGILGSNERSNGWMDEGINSFLETLTMEWKYQDAKIYNGILEEKVGQKLNLEKYPLNYQNEVMYNFAARYGKDQPIQTHSADFTGMNYGSIMYKKTGLSFNYLRNYLGDDLFKECMHAYFEKWKFKHPGPDDIQQIFEETAKRNLDWFFNDVIKTDDVVDYKADGFKVKDGKAQLSVFNAGDIAAPYSVTIMRDTSVVKTIWNEGFETGDWKTIEIPDAKKGDVLVINKEKGSIDIDRGNNNIRTQGILKTREPLRFDIGTGLDDPESTRLFWIPLVGWNEYDKWMPGVSLHNRTIPGRKFEFAWTPMYSIANNRLNGFAMAALNGRRARVGVSSQSFTSEETTFSNGLTFAPIDIQSERVYYQVNPFIEYLSRTITSINPWSLKLRLDGFAVRENFNNIVNNGEQSFSTTNDFFGARASALISKKWIGINLKINPSLDYYAGEENTTAGLARLRVDADFVYHKRKDKKIYVRAFSANTDLIDSFNRGLPIGIGGTRGEQDYFYQNLFMGRSERTGLLGNQIIDNQGGLFTPFGISNFGNSTDFHSIQLEIDAPIGLPISAWGTFGFDSDGNSGYSAGLGLPIVRDIFQIYVPLLFSSDIQNELDRGVDLGWQDYIMMQINLDMMNPFELLKRLN
ncbi:MAG: M1 family metallopeptidase [Flavobacteriales bacterium]|jgi:hypothetical protein